MAGKEPIRPAHYLAGLLLVVGLPFGAVFALGIGSVNHIGWLSIAGGTGLMLIVSVICAGTILSRRS